jgi:hypothetical protein
MEKTLTIRLNGGKSMELECLMIEHDIKTASKMLMHCMERYQVLTETVKFLEEKIDNLEHREAVLTKIIEDARSACAVVVDRTAQQSLLHR